MSAAVKKTGLLFQQVRRDLLKRIQSGEFPLDSQLPTEPELISCYGVSITTVRKAVQQLADEGIVMKRQGMGTFVLRIPHPAEDQANGGKPYHKTLRIGVFLPNTMKLRAEGDSRHWSLNVRRLNGIYAMAAQSNAAVFVHGFGEKTDLKTFDGVIEMPSYAVSLEAEDLRASLNRELDELCIPYVTISEFDPCFCSGYWVVELIELEFFRAVNHLISKGLRRIALIGPNLNWSNPRYSGYRKALERAGIVFDDKLIVENPPSDMSSGKTACAELFRRFNSEKSALRSVDVIFCTTDLQAYGVISWLEEHRIPVPEAMCVMGVDNLPESAALPVPLTSMEFSGPRVGAKAFELLVSILEGKDMNGIILSCPGQIMERESTQFLRK